MSAKLVRLYPKHKSVSVVVWDGSDEALATIRELIDGSEIFGVAVKMLPEGLKSIELCKGNLDGSFDKTFVGRGKIVARGFDSRKVYVEDVLSMSLFNTECDFEAPF